MKLRTVEAPWVNSQETNEKGLTEEEVKERHSSNNTSFPQQKVCYKWSLGIPALQGKASQELEKLSLAVKKSSILL